MPNSAVFVEGLSKSYRIGAAQRETTIREALVQTAKAPFVKIAKLIHNKSGNLPTQDEIWALKDVSFEVKEGEILGIIGRNGAGKSTLLKILSRITDPTEGRAEIRGAVASLLEVGTGFHPELTGRENIYLNAAILGMTRAEIRSRFDEIVAFAEIEKFLDTPVKHYSSGMYVRLAFAVAAHIQPEILIVDEVLAVGDAAFQRKCLGKMSDVVSEGRTVLFVSHNMGAVARLCSRAILLRAGRLVNSGPTDAVIARYLESPETIAGLPLRERTERAGNGTARLTAMRLLNEERKPIDYVTSGSPCVFEISYEATGNTPLRNVFFQVGVTTLMGIPLFVCLTRSAGGNFPQLPSTGRVLCAIPRLPLSPGSYLLSITCKVNDIIADELVNVDQLTVLNGDFFGTGRLPPPSSGPFLVSHTWRIETGGERPMEASAGAGIYDSAAGA